MAATSTLILSICLIFSVLIFLVSNVLIGLAQPTPYMDEVFHIPQTQKYCNLDFFSWDPMITTFPGTYLHVFGLLQTFSALSGTVLKDICNTNTLRITNGGLFFAGTIYILYVILKNVRQDKSLVPVLLEAVIISWFPVLFFFNFLYYTDVGATFYVLATYAAGVNKRPWLSGVLGLVAVFFRQTNIVWVAFTACTVLLKLATEQRVQDASKEKTNPTTFFASVMYYYHFSRRNLFTIVCTALPYLLVGTGFFMFLIINNGIVVGDKTSHAMVFNVPQFFYFIIFATTFAAISIGIKPFVEFLQSLIVLRKIRNYLAVFVTSIIIATCISNLTYAHRYLLADNRHVPFYIWRKTIMRAPYVMFCTSICNTLRINDYIYIYIYNIYIHL